MFVRVIVEGDLDGDLLAESICNFLDIFNSVPQFIANDDWEIEIADDGEESGDASLRWIVDCYPAGHVQWDDVAQLVRVVRNSLSEQGVPGAHVGILE
ncbi:hypothetical protein AB0A91_26150 [Streptomyces sp. NPDC042207]